ASFAGLALARALANAFGNDIRIAVIDRSPPRQAPTADARAFALSAGSQRMLETLAIWPSVASEAQAVHDIEITDSSLDAGVR
ncbi:hypothetical protein ABTO49_21745, partial [Acinetobacter baumannii]